MKKNTPEASKSKFSLQAILAMLMARKHGGIPHAGPPRLRWFRPASMKGVAQHPHYGWRRPILPSQTSKEVWEMIVHSPREFVTRNSPCPCGSGKRFKRCHWQKAVAA